MKVIYENEKIKVTEAINGYWVRSIDGSTKAYLSKKFTNYVNPKDTLAELLQHIPQKVLRQQLGCDIVMYN